MDNRKKLSNTEIKQCKFIVFSDIHYLDKRPELLDFNLSKKKVGIYPTFYLSTSTSSYTSIISPSL